MRFGGKHYSSFHSPLKFLISNLLSSSLSELWMGAHNKGVEYFYKSRFYKF